MEIDLFGVWNIRKGTGMGMYGYELLLRHPHAVRAF